MFQILSSDIRNIKKIDEMEKKIKKIILVLLAVSLMSCNAATFSSRWFSRWSTASKMAEFEQAVEDENAVHDINCHLEQRLIVMPLSPAFNPNQGSEMHGKVQFGDKCSLPSYLGTLVFGRPFEPPWIFEVKPVPKTESEIKVFDQQQQVVPPTLSDSTFDVLNSVATTKVSTAYVSPLDFRAPKNFIFMPSWVMTSLGLSPLDKVDVSFVRLKLAGLVVLQPLTLQWDNLLQAKGDPKHLLEHEINKYSSLTAGTTITIEIEGRQYPLFVKRLVAENGVDVLAVRIQDSDVRVDVDRTVIDQLIANKTKASRSTGGSA